MLLPPLFLLLSSATAQLHYGQNPSPSSDHAALSTVVTFMSEIYTIPLFDPSLAPTFGASLTTLYRPTDLTLSTPPSTVPTPPASSRSKGACSKAASTLGTSASKETSSPSATPSAVVPEAPLEQTGRAAGRSYAGSLCGVVWVAGMVLGMGMGGVM